MELDKTTLVHNVATDLWASLDPFGEQAPFDEQDDMIKYSLKAKVLPVVNLSIPHVEKALKDKLIGIVNKGHEDKLTPEEILLALTFELS